MNKLPTIKGSFQLRLHKLWRQPTAKFRVVGIVTDVHMGNTHESLREIARLNKLKSEELNLGEVIIFVNSPRTAFKALTAGNILLHQRSDDGSRLTASMLAALPHYFGGEVIKGSKTIDAVFSKVLSLE